MKNKLVTILRLELQAALMVSRIKVTILDQMDIAIDSVFLWSDSKTVLNYLRYLRNTKNNFGPYIMRRCNEIRVNTRVENCRYIPSEINIADILSRGVLFDKFHLLSTWFAGLEFLVSNNQNYNFEGLKDKTVCDEVSIETAEDYKGNVNVNVFNVNTKSVSPPPLFWEYYSSWAKIKRHVAWLIKLKSNWLKWKRKQSDRENFSYLSLKELNESEIYLLRRLQQDTYPDEFNKLLHNEDIDKASKIIALNPSNIQ